MAFRSGASSGFFIQAVENTSVWGISKVSEEKLLHQLPKLERYFRLMAERGYAGLQLSSKYRYNYSREELYHYFNNHFPEFTQRVPQYLLASFLGFTPEYLSEIRRKVRS